MDMVLIVVTVVALASGALAGAGRWHRERRSIDKYSHSMQRLRHLAHRHGVDGVAAVSQGATRSVEVGRAVRVAVGDRGDAGGPGRVPDRSWFPPAAWGQTSNRVFRSGAPYRPGRSPDRPTT